jgi:hypothetical protein
MATTEEYIRAFDKTILGIIKTTDNGEQQALDFPSRKILGFYWPKDNTTRDFSYRILSSGNTLVSLIYEYKQKSK